MPSFKNWNEKDFTNSHVLDKQTTKKNSTMSEDSDIMKTPINVDKTTDTLSNLLTYLSYTNQRHLMN